MKATRVAMFSLFRLRGSLTLMTLSPNGNHFIRQSSQASSANYMRSSHERHQKLRPSLRHSWEGTHRNWSYSSATNPIRKDRDSAGKTWGGAPSGLILGNILPFAFVEKLGGLVVGVGAVGLCLLGILYVKQGDMLYIPTIDVVGRDNNQNPPGYRSPAEYDVPFETHMIESSSSDGVSVHSWLLLHPKSKELQLPTIVFFHGNAGHIGIRVPNAVKMYHELNANVLLVEYRGYGESTPLHVKPTESGIKSDCQAVLDFALQHPKIDSSRLFLFGRSLGGAVAFHIADYAQRNHLPLAGVIVENTFESIGHMVDVLLPFLSPFKGILLRHNWDSTALAGKLKVPILYIVGDSDEIVPPAQMDALYAKSSRSILLHCFSVKGGTHNETWLQGGQPYWKAIKKFLIDVSALSCCNKDQSDGNS